MPKPKLDLGVMQFAGVAVSKCWSGILTGGLMEMGSWQLTSGMLLKYWTRCDRAAVEGTYKVETTFMAFMSTS